jgi:hypothetical protein
MTTEPPLHDDLVAADECIPWDERYAWHERDYLEDRLVAHADYRGVPRERRRHWERAWFWERRGFRLRSHPLHWLGIDAVLREASHWSPALRRAATR